MKTVLHDYLKGTRALLLAKLDGLSEYDQRRPLVASGSNLLGLVKHLAGIEYVYLGTSVGRPPAEQLPWDADGSVWDGADMWVQPTESSEYITGLYRAACAHSDESVALLELDAPAEVPHWAEEKRRTTFGALLVRMVDETAHHAGHADIIRELIDNEDRTSEYYLTIQRAAEAFTSREA
ncbi:DinB family protein [Kribbella antibiotica]|uniref:DinB family protein n=1 Tax=Kribbella antibiotica TaxID=190195 RepID=A0A4R4YWZ2_9ACTN|nr:DinB family protein [Kribbella antibiotica]TDD48909.1 DinB family protein [Kribbella antibiotica]